ncbi:MAG: Eco57I restriction-modification methylase domain-containing protein [Caldilineaceae bacterium]
MTTVETTLVDVAESYRIEANQKLDQTTQTELGQFMTPSSVASFMASLFEFAGGSEPIALLDPGAGVGSLSAAFIHRCLLASHVPPKITVDAYELDPVMLSYLVQTVQQCRATCKEAGVNFSGNSIHKNFIADGVERIWNANSLFGQPLQGYTHCIMNPPYKKIHSDSEHRQQLSQIGIETSNLYSAFLAIAIKLLAPHGQLVAIVPRSFCNGVYFKPFRKLLLAEMAIKQLHVFASRKQAFKENDVLQENIILYAVKHAPQGEICITESSDPTFDDMTERSVTFAQVVNPSDADQFIHIATSDLDQMVVDRIGLFTHSIHDLGLDVSTGPVVDFRLKDDLCQQAEAGTVPLIYPTHFCNNQIQWPAKKGRKPNAIRNSDTSSRWLMPNGWYVLTRRFSAKEEKRRIVAALCDPATFSAAMIGFENHLNVFHQQKNGLDPTIAKGLAVYLNSTLVDHYFRQFSGHTQVNATDLRTLHYPSLDVLIQLGHQVNGSFPTQREIDALLELEIAQLSQNDLPHDL